METIRNVNYRPRNRWEDVIKDFKLLKIKNWIKCIQNGEQWRIVEKVKTFKE
jgi:hypothetical protein